MARTATSHSPASRWLDRDLGLLLLLGGVWGAAFPIIRLGLLAGASPLPFAAIRMVLASATVALVAAASRERLPSWRALGLSALWGGGFMVGGYAGLLYWGEATTPGGLSAVLIASVPLWSAIVAYYLLPAERFRRIGTAGIIIGFGGVTLLFLPDLLAKGIGTVEGPLAVVGAALFAAAGSVLLRRTLTTPQGLWTLAAQFATGGAILAVASLGTGVPLTLPWNDNVLLSLAYLVGISSVLGYWIYYRLHHRVGPARANVVTYVNPVAGILVGALLLGEGVGVFEAAGFVVILLGLFLLQRDRLRGRPGSTEGTDAAGGRGDRPANVGTSTDR
ncbi:MAG: EamA family transporter [Thermoplasmata archaeon]|nr:EamA family transporter [Thermoplasmata archaeon]